MQTTPADYRALVRRLVSRTQVTDVHTHLFDPALGPLLLWGIDELLTYHYLAAELFRARPDLGYADVRAMPKTALADLVWKELFRLRSPVSEACRGVTTVLSALGLDPDEKDLGRYRAFFSRLNARDYVDRVFDLAGVRRAYMTNDPLDPQEAPSWERGFRRDPRFPGVLRLDSAIMNWPAGARALRGKGYRVERALSRRTLSEIRRYFNEWCDRLDARYMAVSLPPDFRYPDPDSSLTRLIQGAALPVALERGIPAAMMIGVRKLANPEMGLAGDSVGRAPIETVEALARDFGGIKFLVTMLSRENAHELCVAARKFKNIVVFGCWWFLNNPSLIREITAMRIELLGLTFVPQHSDARVLDQLIYKWAHSRAILADVLASKYGDLAAAGRRVTGPEIKRDLEILLGGGLIESWRNSRGGPVHSGTE